MHREFEVKSLYAIATDMSAADHVVLCRALYSRHRIQEIAVERRLILMRSDAQCREVECVSRPWSTA